MKLLALDELKDVALGSDSSETTQTNSRATSRLDSITSRLAAIPDEQATVIRVTGNFSHLMQQSCVVGQ
jgi:hypothetical protein